MNKLKIGAAAGIASVIVAFSCISAAILSYAPFSWTNNALSDLGVASGVTAPIFNIGLIAAGLFALMFDVVGLYSFCNSRLGKIGAAIFALGIVSLMLIGIFNENYLSAHYLVSVAFFSFAPIGLFVLTASFWRGGHRLLAIFTVALGFVAAVPWLLQLTAPYVPNVAIPESISAGAVSAWAIVLSIKMLRTKSLI